MTEKQYDRITSDLRFLMVLLALLLYYQTSGWVAAFFLAFAALEGVFIITIELCGVIEWWLRRKIEQ